MLRSSSYNIHIPLPQEDKFLLIHGYTGAYDKISQRVMGMLEYLSHGTEEEVSDISSLYGVPEAIIHRLKKRGYITSLSVEEEVEVFRNIARYSHKKGNNGVNYIFFMTYDCNLACPYCFQQQLRVQGEVTGHVLDQNTIDRIYSAIRVIHDRYHGDARKIRIGFYGGEPFLKRQYSAVRYVIEQGKAMFQNEVGFWGVTNGTHLNFYADLLGPGKIQSLQITLDGPPEIHDQSRKYPNGAGSFEQIARNITLALQKGVKVSVRINVEHDSIQYIPALMENVYKRGWTNYPSFRIYTSPVHASLDWMPGGGTLLSPLDLDVAIGNLQDRFPELEAPDDGLQKQIEQIFSAGNFPQFKASYCGAHQGMYIFDPFANIYTCWEVTADPKMRIGYVTSDGNVVLDENNFALWKQQRTVADMTPCQRCPYALYCGGGCAVQAKIHKSSFLASYCDGFQKRFQRAAVAAYYKQFPLEGTRA